MKKTTKNSTIGILVSVVILCVLIIGATIPQIHKCDEACKYGTEAIEVLEKYKKSEITREETEKRLDRLTKLINEEEEKTKSEEEDYHRLFMIRMEIVSLDTKFHATSYVPYYEIDEAIKNIKSNL